MSRRIVSYNNDASYLAGFEKLVTEVYASHPGYAASRAASMCRAVAPANPFFQYGELMGFLCYEGGKPVAHAAGIVDRRVDRSFGFIGFFESLPNMDFAENVVQEVKRMLEERGVREVRGPVDLNTWNGFRVSYPETEPPFLLEPYSRGYYRSVFQKLGFTVARRASSTLHSREEVGFDRYKNNFETLSVEGFTFATANRETLPAFLRDTHTLIGQCFRDTWSFIPISLPEFEYASEPLTKFEDRLLLHVAYCPDGNPVGYLFGSLDECRGKQRAIVKTIAAAPSGRRLMVGRALAYQFFETVTLRGVSEFIFSTIGEDNRRIRVLTPGPRSVYRRYEAYEMTLEERPPCPMS